MSLLFCEVIIVHNHFSYSLLFYILKLTDNSSTLNKENHDGDGGGGVGVRLLFCEVIIGLLQQLVT